MGLFNRLGREVEEFVQTAKRAADEADAFRCPACERVVEGEHERCPHCGERDLEPTTVAE